MNVKRYECELGWTGAGGYSPIAEMAEDQDGQWVRYDDYAALEAQLPESMLNCTICSGPHAVYLVKQALEVLNRPYPGSSVADLPQPDLTHRGMPQGAQNTSCTHCGWTYGTHSPDCPHSQESV